MTLCLYHKKVKYCLSENYASLKPHPFMDIEKVKNPSHISNS